MPGRDPDTQRMRPDSESQRRAQVGRFAVDTRVQGPRRVHFQPGRGPGAAGRGRPVAGHVQDQDAELPGVERRPGAGKRAVQCVWIVRYQHNSGLAVLASRVVHQA